MVRTNIDIQAIEWLKSESLLEEFNEAMKILKLVMPDICVESIKLYKTPANNTMVTCVIDNIERTDFIIKRKAFFDDILGRCPTVYKHLKIIRSSRFGDETTVEIR